MSNLDINFEYLIAEKRKKRSLDIKWVNVWDSTYTSNYFI